MLRFISRAQRGGILAAINVGERKLILHQPLERVFGGPEGKHVLLEDNELGTASVAKQST